MRSFITALLATSALANSPRELQEDWGITNIIHAEPIPRSAKGVGMMASAITISATIDEESAA